MFDSAIKQLEDYEMGYAKVEIEKFFWDYCDNYIEIVKNRLYKPEIYGEDAKLSGLYALYNIHLGLMKLFAMFMPHITEEVYQAYFKEFENEISIHKTILSKIDIVEDGEILAGGEEFINIISEIRQYKSEKQVSVKTQIENLKVKTSKPNFIESAKQDLTAVCSILNLNIEKANELSIEYGNFVEVSK